MFSYKFFKRIGDFLSACVGLIILIPIISLITIVSIFIYNGKPFFFQKRAGFKEKPFWIVKFKTMTATVDQNGKLLPDVDRLNKWGSFLRKSSLDEIPQLFNVIIGDMSIIGPRPLMINYLPYYTAEEKLRHRVLPGITGLAQIKGRNTIDWDLKLQYDCQYVKNLSFANDFKILWETAINVISSKDVIIDTYSVEPDFDEYRKTKKE
ncbi:sugar transferase [uncultured Croceitalea sp.]|uniref:sugar transferase n=1 Tax=uncultured Croceitalea sp. TaxID=1798908 RepID=UPI00330639AB